MISKDQFVQSLLNETRIVKHLFTKIPDNTYDYRPTPGQRSTLELLQYIALIIGSAIELTSGKENAFDDFEARKAAVTKENFIETLEAEEKKIAENIAAFTEEQLAETTMQWGASQTRAMHLLGLLKIAAAYKTQLFLYIKANGVTNIGTSNLWGGMDM
ncbi:MAG: hypothetical protein JWM20_74 [Patescibacteria group bacterium]|nr:hypothetical protein [Patescibacteria group bacterium]